MLYLQLKLQQVFKFKISKHKQIYTQFFLYKPYLGLELDKIENKPWHISSSNALTGEGLQDGVSWLVQQIKECMAANSNKEVKKEMEHSRDSI